jgi:hypothetical protein
VDARIGHAIVADELVFGIDIDVIFVTEVAAAVLLGPARIAVFLRQFMGAAAQPSGISPALMAVFSSLLLRCFRTATMVASTIWPPRAM